VSSLFVEDTGPQPPRILKTAPEVISTLRILLDNRTPLQVRFADRSRRFQTFLINIDRDKGWVAIDELIPNDGERMLVANEPFEIEGYQDGVRIAWTNQHAVHLGELDDARCYWAAIPPEILYHQRRNAYRAQLFGKPVGAELTGKTFKSPLEGKLLDMSATGCKVSFSGDVQARLQTGQVYDQLSASLPIGAVKTAVEVRHVVFDEKLNVTFCGMRFHRVAGLTQRNIERFVYQLQREAKRDQTPDR
jgi:c-di-GMP-binding flagellar brake protein YcgR